VSRLRPRCCFESDVTASLPKTPAAAILLDIEGTTTPIDFVYEILFPYAREHVKDFLETHLSSEEVRADIAALREEQASDVRGGLDPPEVRARESQPESIAAYAQWLMDQDRKSTPLKSLQGKIWEEGYRAGHLRGRIFPDVPPAFRRWSRQGKQICIYSSGSRLAQKLLFAHTEAGDLSGLIREYFDTRTGAKADPQSYRLIASSLGMKPAEIIFISDVTRELSAARSAGMQTLLCVRPGNHPQPDPESYRAVSSFDEVVL
jgi:enolase-phosphatase E1